MDKKTAFIGSGNMGSAMMGGIVKSGVLKPCDITACDKNQNRLDKLKTELGVKVTKDAKTAADADIIFLCVEPKEIPEVCTDIYDKLNGDKTVVSIAAGVTSEKLHTYLKGYKNIIRVMPNLPILAGCGMSMLCENDDIPQGDFSDVAALFESFGETVIMDESKIHAFASLASSSPAFIFMLIEAMAEGGVLMGIDHASSLKIASQTVLGSAKMVLQSGTHPAELKDRVCTPGGMTVEGVAYLESAGFRNALIEAVRVSAEKSIMMSGQKTE